MEIGVFLRRIRSLDPYFSARARGFQEYGGIEPADTRSEPGPYIFGTYPPNVQPFQRETVDSASFELGISEASFHKFSARPASPITTQPSRLEPGTSKYHAPTSSSRRLRSSSAPSPPPLLPTALALISEPIPKFQNTLVA